MKLLHVLGFLVLETTSSWDFLGSNSSSHSLPSRLISLNSCLTLSHFSFCDHQLPHPDARKGRSYWVGRKGRWAKRREGGFWIFVEKV